MRYCHIVSALMVALAASAASAQLDSGAHSDFEIGQDGTINTELIIRGDEEILDGSEFIILSPGTGVFTNWFVNDEPGWASALADDPPDMFELLGGHQVALLRVAFSTGFEMFDPNIGGPGSGEILENDLDSYEFPQDGFGDFHVDLVYAAPPGTNVGDTFSATYQLVDLGAEAVHSPSKEFTLNFKVVPEPATLGLLLVAGAGLRRRGRTS